MLSAIGRRILTALAVGILVIVLIPVLVILDSYRIVPDMGRLARETPDRTAIMDERLADPRTPRPLRHHQVGLGAISPHLIHAVIVHEDATFYQHRGFDTFEMRLALRRSLEERQLGRGASTITTQLARCLYLGTERSVLRKIREIPLTVRLERALSKQRILELYLNVVEWGPGVFGAEAASRHHFGVSARDLTPAEAALLAAALPSPRRSTPARPSNYLRRRAAIILTRMEARGWLSSGDVSWARIDLGLPASTTSLPQPEAGTPPDLAPELDLEPESQPELDVETEPENGTEPEIPPAELAAPPDSSPGAPASPDAPPTHDPPATPDGPITPGSGSSGTAR